MPVISPLSLVLFFFFNDTATTEIYTLSLHDALPICLNSGHTLSVCRLLLECDWSSDRSEEHTSELQSHSHLVCRLLLEKTKCSEQNHDNVIATNLQQA